MGQKRTQSFVTAEFAEPLVLPIGESYTFTIAAGSIISQADPTASNGIISKTFEVPSTLGPGEPSIDEGATIEWERSVNFYWGTETLATDKGHVATLYREHEAVRQYPIEVSSDWDLGCAHIDFGGKLYFDNGVRYSLVIPAEAVSAERPDIVNEESVINFIGAHTEAPPTIDYVWCSLFTDHPSDKLGAVSFYYDRAVRLGSDPKVELWIEEDNRLVKTVVPTLSEAEGRWILTADFGQTPLEAEKGYTIVIAENTLVSTEGAIAVNSRKTVPVGSGSGIAPTRVAGTPQADIHSIDGTLIVPAATEADLRTLPAGIYIFNGTKYRR